MNNTIIRTINYTHNKLLNYGYNVDYDDIYQDLSLKYYEAQEKYKPELASFKTYWNKIVRNYIREVMRTFNREGVYSPIAAKKSRRPKPFYRYIYQFHNEQDYNKFYYYLCRKRIKNTGIKQELKVLTDHKTKPDCTYEQYRISYHIEIEVKKTQKFLRYF